MERKEDKNGDRKPNKSSRKKERLEEEIKKK